MGDSGQCGLEADCDAQSDGTIEVTMGAHGILADAAEIMHCAENLP